MNFKRDNIATFESSFSFLIDSMLKTCHFLSKNVESKTKSSWSIQTEKFSSFFERIRSKTDVMDNLRSKVVYPIFDTNSSFILDKLISDDNVVQDEFMKVEEDTTTDFKIKTKARGILFSVDRLYLPISEVYTEAVNYSISNKRENIPFPVQILLGFYSCIYHSILGVESDEQASLVKQNIDVLVDSLETCDVPKEQNTRNPMNMLQSMLGNIDMKQIGEMMGKVTGDKEASKEFGEVFGKMTEAIKSGSNPMEIMGDIIKNAAENTEDVDVDSSGPPGEEVSETPQAEVSETPQEEVSDEGNLSVASSQE